MVTGASSFGRSVAAYISRPRLSDDTSPDRSGVLITMRPRQAQVSTAIVLSLAWVGAALAIGASSRFGGASRTVFEVILASPILFSLNSLRRRVRVSDDGVELFSQWIGVRHCAWHDLKSARLIDWGQTLRLYPIRGLPIVIPSTMTGIKVLERLIREKAPGAECNAAFTSYRRFIGTL